VRVLCNSVLLHNNVTAADLAIKLDPEKSITRYAPGDTIALDEPTFVALSTAFFAEIERKCV
jgi:hypothetical protein